MTVGEYIWNEFCRYNTIDPNKIIPSEIKEYYKPMEGDENINISLSTFHVLLLNMRSYCLTNTKEYAPVIEQSA